ncbi:MAG: hypothetical protein M5U08_23045 [Burkholderiales bacterium]|nr:hypothetical protein [Burkholderiales bacterium]
MAEANALPASVVFLRLADFGAKPVAEQARLKEGLEDALEAAIAPLDAARRIVLDAPEGAAVVVLDGAETALALGERLGATATGLPLAVGINHGPVRLAAPGAHGPALVGDALAASAAVAEFAQPGAMLVSRSFRDALAESAPERAEALRPSGTYTDATVRAHELFAPGGAQAGSRRRRAFVLGTLGVFGILAAGVAVRRTRHARAERSRQPALLALAVRPWGDVYVDRERRGRTPPLEQLEVPAGRHTIEVRNGDNAPLTLQVDLQPGQSMTVRHAFRRRLRPWRRRNPSRRRRSQRRHRKRRPPATPRRRARPRRRRRGTRRRRTARASTASSATCARLRAACATSSAG